MKPYAEEFYKSAAWKTCRDIVMRRDAYLCRDCLAAGRYTPAEEVHHIEPLCPDNIHRPEVALNLDNLISLCRECHKARHMGRPVKRYTVDNLGRVVLR